MLSRKATFGISFTAGVCVHAVFFALAPSIILMHANSAPASLLATFRVKLQDAARLSPTESEGEGAQALASRPGSVTDLLELGRDELLPEALDDMAPAEIPALEDRIAADQLARDYDLETDGLAESRVDARILEISQEAARREIEVPRRLVRPSPERVLGEGEYPTLRTSLAGVDDGPLRVDSGGRSLLAENAGPDFGGSEGPLAEGEKPRYEEAVLDPIEIRETVEMLPEISLARNVPRASVAKESEAIRQQSEYEFIDDLVSIDVDTFFQQGEDKGYFRLRILPKDSASLKLLPKDVTFVLDASTSIPQHKLNISIRGLLNAVNLLKSEDRFNIVVFRDSSSLFQADHVPASAANKEAARRFLNGQESKGGTDIYQGILPVIQDAPPPGVPGVVLLVSDGRPTSGILDARSIINALTADNRGKNSVYTFSGGRTVNRYLLDLLSYRNKGASFVSSDIATMDLDLPKFFSQLSDPLLANLETDYGRIDESEVVPRHVPDFYRGQAVTVYGRFDPEKDGEFVMRLTGETVDGRKELVFRTDLQAGGSGDPEIARNWAFQKAYDLIGEISRLGERPELLAQLKELSSKYNIRTIYDE